MRREAFLAGAGVAFGVLALGLLRLAILPPLDHVHYHANWALWIEGERVDFSADRYMEDVAACAAESADMQPEQRAHLHANEGQVVHVHDHSVTWGHLLQNLGWAIGPDWILTDELELHREGGDTAGASALSPGTGSGSRGPAPRLTYVVNGLAVLPAHDRLIQPGDRILISFGTEPVSDLVNERFPTVASDAPEYDETYDPAGCAGQADETFGERLRRAFWF